MEHRLITDVTELKKRFPECFDVIRNIEGKYSFVTDLNGPPAQHTQYKIPIALQEKIEAKLHEMVEQGIITPVTEPAKWVNSITYPIKPNADIQMCLDRKDINKVIIKEHYKAPTLEKITHKLTRASVFSKLESFQSFSTIHLSKESSMKTTCNTRPGHVRYHYLHLTIGTITAKMSIT